MTEVGDAQTSPQAVFRLTLPCPSRRSMDGAECERERGHDENHRMTVWEPWSYYDLDTEEYVTETAPSYPEFWTDEQEAKK
jgi:hypothetical protein